MRVALGLFLLSTGLSVSAQTTATLSGIVLDPQGAAVSGATLTLAQPVTGYRHELKTPATGAFQILNIPPQSYQLTVEAAGFHAERRTVALRSNVPVTLEIRLKLESQVTSVDVTAFDTGIAIDPSVTGTKTELNSASIAKLPVSPASRGLEQVLLSFPGFAANANGAIHPRGAHNQMTFVVDGMPVSDQLTGSFANAIDPSIVDSIELYTGNIPAEFGSKISGVAVVTTRSGIGSGRRFSGSTQVTAAQFDTLTNLTQFAGGRNGFGYFASFNILKSNRYLDQVSLDNLQNGGNSERGFARFDWQASARNLIRANVSTGRSSFQLANLRSQHANLQDQRQGLTDYSASMSAVHTLNARSTVEGLASFRNSFTSLLGSPGDTPVTATQSRRLTNWMLGARGSRVSGAHNLRGGVDWMHFPLRERFTFGISNVLFNAPESAGFNPSLAPFDLTRAGRLFQFSKSGGGSMYSGFAQDNVKLGRWQLSLGLRFDNYRFLVTGSQWQPRTGVSYHVKETGTVFRASYNRTMQTPPNENLLLSNSEEAAVLAPPGGGFRLIRPERQNVYEGGLQQQMGRFVSFNGSFYHKDSTDLQDNDNFFNTGIIFPTSLAKARVNGAEGRFTLLPVKRVSGSLSFTHYHAIVTPPFTGGLFLGAAGINALAQGPFVIDHDQTLSVQGNLFYQVRPDFWVSGQMRYDSGLVSNASNPERVALDPDYADLLPYVNLGSNPPRVEPRTIFDLAAGYERKRDGRRRWDAIVQVANLLDKTALYNFQSPFVGTRLVQPRTASVRWKWYF